MTKPIEETARELAANVLIASSPEQAIKVACIALTSTRDAALEEAAQVVDRARIVTLEHGWFIETEENKGTGGRRDPIPVIADHIRALKSPTKETPG